MPWPTSQEYNEAIQCPQDTFADVELRDGQAVTNALGIPMPCSGNFADVYKFHCAKTGRTWAIKCFTRYVPNLRERYIKISQHLEQAKLPFMVDFTFLQQGIKIGADWYPILKMQWVEGFTLNQFLNEYLDKPQVLESLCQLWLRLAKKMRVANLAHCDLQHGNVLLVPGTKGSMLYVKLVDYDGMWVPALAEVKSNELGHPAYQHPQRLHLGSYNLEVDRFPNLLIYTALRGLLVGGRSLWERFDNGDNVLFSQKDFENPDQSAVFQQLQDLNDPEVQALAQTLALAARRPLATVPLLDELPPAPASVRQSQQTHATPAGARTVVSSRPSAGGGNKAHQEKGQPAVRPKQRARRRNSRMIIAGSAIGAVAALLLAGLVIFAAVRAASKGSTTVASETNSQEVHDGVSANTSVKSSSSGSIVRNSRSIQEPGSSVSTSEVVKSPPQNGEVGPLIYVADLQEFDVKMGPWKFGKGTMGNQENTPIRVNRVPHPRGLAMHAPANDFARVKYRLDKNMQTFVASVAIDDSADRTLSPVTFSVLGDERVLWTSKAIQGNRDIEDVSLDVRGVEVLELRAHCAGRLEGAYAVWVDPVVTVKKEIYLRQLLQPVRSVQITNKVEWFSTSGEMVGDGSTRAVMELDGTESPRGIWMHPKATGYSSAEFRLDGRFRTLRGKAAIPTSNARADQRDPVTPVTFEIRGQGGAVLWQSQPLKKKSDREAFAVDVRGVDELELRVKCPGPNNWAWAGWIEPVVDVDENGSGSVASSEPLSPLALVTRPTRIAGVKSWTIQTRQATAIPNYYALAWSPDGSMIAFGGEFNTIGLWEENTSRPVRHLVGHKEPVNSLAWSQDGKTLASGTGPRVPDNPRFWDTDSGTVKEIVKQVGDNWSWSPDLNHLATFRSTPGDHSTVRLFDRKDGKATHNLNGHTGRVLTGTAWSPNGKSIASSDFDGTVRIWDPGSGNELHKLVHPSSDVNWVAWSPDGKQLASAAGKVGYIWDADSAKIVRRLEGHKGNVGRVTWSPDGTKLATASDDNTCRIWEADTGTTIRVFDDAKVRNANFLSWSPDGHTLATGGDASILFWEADTGQLRATLLQLPNERTLVVSASGHYRAAPELEGDLVYVVQTDSGQETLTPAEFAKKYDWKNNQRLVRLIGANPVVPPGSSSNSPNPESGSGSGTSTGPLGMKFVKVPKGIFWRSNLGIDAQFQETVNNDFYMGVYTVTQEEWQSVMGKNSSYFSRDGAGKDLVNNISDADLNRFPVENVSWNDLQEFLKKLNERGKKTGWKYRLPTEIEWE